MGMTCEEGMYAREIENALSTKWAGHPVFFAREIDSTNLWAQREALQGAGHGLLTLADYQSAGRGSRGRSWEEKPGKGIMMSILLRPCFTPDRGSMLTLVMGMAVAKATQELGMMVSIKWPNDVVVSKKKVCGILTEMRLQGNQIQDVVVGVGINVNVEVFPQELEDKATSFYLETGQRFDRVRVIDSVMKAFEEYYELFEEEGNLSLLKESYEAMLVNKGAPVKVLEKVPYEGIAQGIDEWGRLLVEREDGTLVKVNAGEVSVRGLYSYV